MKGQYTRKEVEDIFNDFEKLLFEIDRKIFGTGKIPKGFYSIKQKHMDRK